jgi:hypothetical protein
MFGDSEAVPVHVEVARVDAPRSRPPNDLYARPTV